MTGLIRLAASRGWRWLLLLCLSCLAAPSLASLPVDLVQLPAGPLGAYADYLQESAGPMTLAEAENAWAAGRFKPVEQPVLSLGVGAKPAWVRLTVSNSRDDFLVRRLQLDATWLDAVDIYAVHGGEVLGHHQLGDAKPYADRPVPGRLLAADQMFPPGQTELYLRIATPDALMVPLYVLPPDVAVERGLTQGYGFGFLYGYLLALAFYNLALYFNLRNRVYLLYGGFLGTFLLLNLSYTGHGYAWLWPEWPAVQARVVPCFMVLYSVVSLSFAKSFLDTARRLPRLHRTLSGLAIAFIVLLSGTAVFADDQRYMLEVAIVIVTLASLLMPVIGLLTWRKGYSTARYFVFATLASMSGALITAFTAWGFVPFSDWAFHAAEIGVLADATILALALGNQFRVIKADQLRAERRAAVDPLTGLRNRRSFVEAALPAWQAARADTRPLAAVMLDIDHFKGVNDVHGHSAGDAVLAAVARALTAGVREGDIVSRWGGEEFLLLLPNTDLAAAAALAERLRQAVADVHLSFSASDERVTASFGVAEWDLQESLDRLINRADGCLYHAKRHGRNRVSCEPAGGLPTARTPA